MQNDKRVRLAATIEQAIAHGLVSDTRSAAERLQTRELLFRCLHGIGGKPVVGIQPQEE